jgi:hypothetical protein
MPRYAQWRKPALHIWFFWSKAAKALSTTSAKGAAFAG